KNCEPAPDLRGLYLAPVLGRILAVAGPVVEVRGPGDAASTYPVRYTFGVEPLQQYLVDVGSGRLQALPVAWDARPAAEGGQRWFDLQDDPAPPGSPLHWLGPAFTWNDSCAACHSTGVDKGYDRAARRYQTTFAEIDVGCEACHGQGSRHVASARSGHPEPMPHALVKPDTRAWMPQPDGPIAKLQGADPSDPELGRCAPCHSRRTALEPATGAVHDASRIALLEDGLYFANGQILDEVFVLGSFLQSKMHAAGVVCSDCHEPHGLKLRARGNTLCATCHRPEVFDTVEHHLHPPESPGAQCTACHMPQRTYMGVDDRADHRFGVPQPLLAAEVGAPDPCVECHPTQAPAEAAEAIGARGPRSPASFGEALLAARRDEPSAAALLVEVLAEPKQPAIVRATALQELGHHAGPELLRQIQRATEDADPLMRRTAAGLADALPPALRQSLVVPLLQDPSRSVRVEAVGALIGAAPPLAVSPDAPGFRRAREEYRRVQEASADRAHGLTNLALLARFDGDLASARDLLEEAIALEPADLAANLGLADLHRAAGHEARAEAALRRALAVVEDRAVVQHALGLTLVRLGRSDEALEPLAAAHATRPDVARYGYVYAVALFDADRRDEAVEVLGRVHERHPADADVLETLAAYCEALGQHDDARRHRDALRSLRDPRQQGARGAAPAGARGAAVPDR
ncbi:MAG: tetratricopeptide repeat protein, partial [Myxococcales bacterium]|nr:tetratricopeptide repeat protein [Myxococcales bacterium]